MLPFCSRGDFDRTTAARACSGREAFDRVPLFPGEVADAVERVPTKRGRARGRRS
jgi:hypothetical protein